MVAVRPRYADGLVRQVYGQIHRELGVVAAPFAIHSPVPELLAGVWIACRETLVVGQVPRHLKEAVAAAVSEVNACPYCVDTHMTMLHASHHRRLASVIGEGGQPNDERTAAIVEWSRLTRSPGAPSLRSPPFDLYWAPELIGTAFVFHYVNRMATALLCPSLPGGGRRRRFTSRALGWWFARAVRRTKQPGTSLGLLDPGPLPPSLAWSTPSPNVAGALARFAAAIGRAGDCVIDQPTRELVGECVAGWEGEQMPLSRSWVGERTVDLPPDSRASARLALLAALAPHQIDDELLLGFMGNGGGDREIVATLAWGSFAAASRVGEWVAALPAVAAA